MNPLHYPALITHSPLVKNEWLPVLKAAVRCNFSVKSESDGLVLSSPYEPCMESKVSFNAVN